MKSLLPSSNGNFFLFSVGNQKLANMFLGYVALCLLAWYSNWVPLMFGVAHVETSDRAISFNSLGHHSGMF